MRNLSASRACTLVAGVVLLSGFAHADEKKPQQGPKESTSLNYGNVKYEYQQQHDTVKSNTSGKGHSAGSGGGHR